MENFAAKLGLLTVLKDSVTNRVSLRLALLFLLLFLGLSGGAAGGRVQDSPATSFGPGPQFAIADFDGDVRPDLASIQAGANSFGNTSYWIQLQLSAAGRQSIHLAAPSGGLLIEARDVNGDHAIDLVLATAWFRQPVAILLNDGHGSFSRVEPTAFPGAFSGAKTNWNSVSNQSAEAIGLPSQSRAGISAESKSLLRGRSPATVVFFSCAEFCLSAFLISHAGRAPPEALPVFL